VIASHAKLASSCAPPRENALTWSTTTRWWRGRVRAAYGLHASWYLAETRAEERAAMHPLETNDQVFLRSVGLARVTDFAGRDASGRPTALGPGEAPVFYVVRSAARTTMVPIATAERLLRPLVLRDVASHLLQILRQDDIQPADGLDSVNSPRSSRIVDVGSPEQHASFLRELYALPELDHRQAMALLAYEDMVLDEIAQVLGENRERLVAEMRTRYPAFEKRAAQNRAGKSSDGPRVVAAPVERIPAGIKTKLDE
jgi:hypothetical protein